MDGGAGGGIEDDIGGTPCFVQAGGSGLLPFKLIKSKPQSLAKFLAYPL
jgi:hypothetical protein